MALLSMLVGMTSCSAKQSFDAIVQRDAPDANRGRSFARFETRFQLLWVIGALVPIIVPMPAATGFALIAVATSLSAITYLIGMRNLRAGRLPTPRRGVLRRRVVVDGRHPAARDDTATDLGFAPPVTPVVVGGSDDPTIDDRIVPDPARRWMRAPVPDDPTTAIDPAPRPARPVRPSAPSARPAQGGRLFDDEAWEDPPDDGVVPPF